MGSDGMYSSLFIATAGDAAEGAYLTSTSVVASKLTGPGADWYRRYKARFQNDQDYYVPNAFEAMNVALLRSGALANGIEPRSATRSLRRATTKASLAAGVSIATVTRRRRA